MADRMMAIVARRSDGRSIVEIVDVDRPVVGHGQIVVKVHSVGLNFRDIHTVTENETDRVIPGTDFAGVVESVGDSVSDVAVGDRVFGAMMDSAFAQYVVTVPAMVFPIPPSLSFDEAACIPVSGLSASFLASDALAAPGRTVAVRAAAGGLGCFLGAVLRARGATTIAITSSDEKLEVAKSAGFDHVVNYRSEHVVERVRELTNGLGVDVVIDSVSGAQFGDSFSMLRNGGLVILCGTSGGEPPASAIAQDFLGSRRNLALREFYLVTHVFDHFDQLPSRIDELVGLVTSGASRVPVKTYSFEDFADAFNELDGGQSIGKLALQLV